LLDLPSRVGGGALPLQELPSKCVGMKIAGMSANYMERRMRKNSPPIIGRIEDGLFIADFRTIRKKEIPVMALAVKNLLKRGGK
jgi:L-seryl-tRNA(Ser) seleniumtransferase